jgi:hypothetical protein
MKEHFRQLLAMMKEKVVNNLAQVKDNEKDIRMLLQQKDTFEKYHDLKLHFKTNKAILAENMDYLELQIKLVNFINKYRNSEFMKSSRATVLQRDPAEIDYFTETTTGLLEFNEYHPFYRDEIFLNKLAQYYLDIEDYKECQRLEQIRKKISL